MSLPMLVAAAHALAPLHNNAPLRRPDAAVGCWQLLVPELNAMPGRHAYDETEFVATEEVLERVEALAECAVLSTCDRYCVFAAPRADISSAVSSPRNREGRCAAGTTRSS